MQAPTKTISHFLEYILKIYPFFSNNHPYSNWYKVDFVTDVSGIEIQFNCLEQFMMLFKAVLFDDEKAAKAIMATTSPREQKLLGRKVKNFDDTIWYLYCREAMKQAIRAKFTSSPEMKKELEKSVGMICVETSPFDKIWGIGMKSTDPGITDIKKWKGQNILGWLITEVRLELFSE